jgi:hypothetical protein
MRDKKEHDDAPDVLAAIYRTATFFDAPAAIQLI